VFVDKLFTGLKDWNFGLFIQEIFKQDMIEKDDCIKKCMDEFDTELASIDAHTMENVLQTAFPHLAKDKLDDIVQFTFDQNLNKIISKKDVKKKLMYFDCVGHCME
jgi:hypothetical protein